jgi:transposase
MVDLVEALKKERNARVREDFNFYDRFSLNKAAETVGRTKRTIFNWVKGLGRGIEALRDKHGSGRPRKASRSL